MASNNNVKIIFNADTNNFNKSVENSAKKLNHTTKQAKQTKVEVSSLGKTFTQTANNVAIFNGQLDPISGRLSAIGTGITRFGVANIALGVGVSALTLSIGKAIGAFDQYEKRQLRFNALLNATGHSARLAAGDLEALANQIGRDTLSNTEEAAEGINALLTFRKVQGETFKETIKLARDAQVAFGGNLREGVVAFGKALNDPIANLGALSRKGIQFSDAQKEMIHQFWEMGDAASAQNIILQEMRDQFGGLAEQEAKTLEGKVDSLGHAWDRMWEKAGQTKSISNLSTLFGEIIDYNTQLLVNIKSNIGGDTRFFEETRQLYLDKKLAQQNYNDALDKEIGLKAQIKEWEDKLASGSTSKYNATKQIDSLNKSISQLSVGYFKDRLDEANQAHRDFGSEQDKIQEEQNLKAKKANEIRLAAEKEDNRARLEETVKIGEKLRIANASRYESETEKQERFYEESLKKNQLQFVREINHTKQANGDIAAVIKKWKGEFERIETGHQNKLDEIDKRKAAREAAELLREERKTEKLVNAARKRQKLLEGIEGAGGDAGLNKITQNYLNDVRALSNAEFEKTEITDRGFKTREQLLEAYGVKLALAYDGNVEKYKQAQASKTAATIEEAAAREAAEFDKKVDAGFAQVENGAGAVQDFFGVNIDEFKNKQEVLYQAKVEADAKIRALGLNRLEEEKRLSAVETEYKLKQAEVEKNSRVKATGDMWSALSTVGASGSKKAFAIAKAANIAQATINTYAAASNALAQPYPAPIPQIMAAAITAAGFVNVRNIKNQPMPQFHDGITTVPREGTYLLDQGERVVSSKLNADLKADIASRKNGNNGSGDTSINLTIPDTGSYNATEQWYEDNRNSIISDIRYGMERV